MKKDKTFFNRTIERLEWYEFAYNCIELIKELGNSPSVLEDYCNIAVIIVEIIFKIFKLSQKSKFWTILGILIKLISIAFVIYHTKEHPSFFLSIGFTLKVANLVNEIIEFRKEQL